MIWRDKRRILANAGLKIGKIQTPRQNPRQNPPPPALNSNLNFFGYNSRAKKTQGRAVTPEIDEIKSELQQHIDEKQEMSASDVAEHLRELKRQDEAGYTEFLRRLDDEQLGEVAIELPEHMLKDVLQTLPSEKIADAIDELDSDDATDLLQNIEEIDEAKADEIFSNLDAASQQEITKLINYDDGEAGAYMQTELFAATASETLQTAICRLRRLKREEELDNVYQLFVTDGQNVLKAVIPLDDLLLFETDLRLSEIIARHPERYAPKTALDTDEIADVAAMVQDFALRSVAVVNRAGVLLGRITPDDIHDFVQESATEQIYNLAGVNDVAEEETIFRAGRSRALWLLVNLFTAFLGAAVIGAFETTIAQFVALAALMPLVASMGGNTGTQALAVTVRRLAVGEIEFSDVRRVLAREALIALMNGAVFALLVGAVAWAWFGLAALGGVIAAAILINLVCAGFFGACIPLVLKRVGVDPAVGSSVLLTTATDIIGFFAFLLLATIFLI